MHDFISEDTKATLLLCGTFDSGCAEKPLSLGEYTRLVRWLMETKLRPSDLQDKGPRYDACSGTGLLTERLDTLFARGLQLGFAVEEWQRSGIWILGRSDADYPARYKQSLKDKAPPLLFGVGDRQLLQGGGLGIVGSRNVDEEGERFTRHVATLCVRNHMPVVSGGAKGVDHIAMHTALQCGGYAIGVVADNLLKRSVESANRTALAHGSLVLLTPYNPSMPFAPWAAMERNKLIYAMADFGLVVSTDLEKGGTWTGATEELKREHGRLVFVRHDDGAPSGNKKLISLGALAWPQDAKSEGLSEQLHRLVEQKQSEKKAAEPSLFDFLTSSKKETPLEPKPCPASPNIVESVEMVNAPQTIYDAVLPIIIHVLQTADDGLSLEELAQRLDIHKTQLSMWLKKAVEDSENKKIQKLAKPVRYAVIAP